jgi:hypothetical protein
MKMMKMIQLVPILKRLIKLKMNRLMDSCVSWLNRKTESCPPIKKKIGIVLFCLLSGSICLYIIVSPMLNDSSAHSRFLFQRPLFLTHIPAHRSNHFQNPILNQIPIHIGKPDLPTDPPIISKQLYERIESFKNNDSLMKADPRLLDSIHAFEQLYQSQIKK